MIRLGGGDIALPAPIPAVVGSAASWSKQESDLKHRYSIRSGSGDGSFSITAEAVPVEPRLCQNDSVSVYRTMLEPGSEPALPPEFQRSAGAEALVGGLTGGAEGLADLLPGCAFLVASQGHVGAGEPVGGGGHAGGRNCQNEVT